MSADRIRGAERLSRREIYAGRVFRVEVDRVALPSGHVVDMELVRHPGSVVLVPQPAPDTIVLIRQFRYSIGEWIWELPAGSLKPGEDPREAAVRECEEEIGLVPGRVEPLGSYFPTPGFCDERMNYFRCLDLGTPSPDSTAARDEDEQLEPSTFSLDEARQMIRRGTIVDLKTIAGLMLL